MWFHSETVSRVAKFIQIERTMASCGLECMGLQWDEESCERTGASDGSMIWSYVTPLNCVYIRNRAVNVTFCVFHHKWNRKKKRKRQSGACGRRGEKQQSTTEKLWPWREVDLNLWALPFTTNVTWGKLLGIHEPLCFYQHSWCED